MVLVARASLREAFSGFSGEHGYSQHGLQPDGCRASGTRAWKSGRGGGSGVLALGRGGLSWFRDALQR